MRKFTIRAAATLLFACLLLSLRTVPLQAASANLLTNPGFESGTTGWTAADGATLTAGTRVTSPKNSGSYAMKVTKPANKNWFDMVQNPLPAMKSYGDGKYTASCYIQGTSGQQVRLTIKLFLTGNTANYLFSDTLTLSSTWQKMEFTFNVLLDSCSRIEFYWTSPTNTTANDVTIYVDDCSLVFTETANTSGMTSPDKTIVRPQKTLVGAIRWDAYFATSSSPASYTIADQVARTLSYYQAQAPYFTKVRTTSYDVKVKFASAGVTYKIDDVASSNLATRTINYTYGTTWESEVRYALNAGIDYFAYLWYNSEHADREHRQMALPHLAHSAQNGYLPDGRQMKMCAILPSAGVNGVGTPADLTGKTESQKLSAILRTRKELYQAMAQSSYLCITNSKGEIPVVYVYTPNSFLSGELDKIREEAKFFTAWLAKKNPSKYRAITDIYFVAMAGSSVSYDKETEYRTAGFSALTRYADNPGASSGSSDYQALSITRYEYDDLSRSKGTSGTAKSAGYARLSNVNYEANNRYASMASRISCVPLATAGWNCLPRIKTGVSWSGDYGWQYTRTGTPKEIAANISKNLAWIDAHAAATPTNLMLIYAWNEHDEGGYICPTVKTDAKGNILTDSKGNAQVDTSILDAISTVLWEHKGKPLKKGDVNGDGSVTAIDRALLARALADWNVEKWVVRLQCGDIDGDGSVTTQDRTILSRYLAQWSNTYSAYFS